MEKQALVLSGGGSLGSYQMGAIKALNELGYEFDIVTGTSVGSLNGAIYVQGEFEIGYHIWDHIEYNQVVEIDFKEDKNKIFQLVKSAAFNKGLDTSPLETLLFDYLDEDKIRNSKTKFGLVVVKFPSMKPFELTIDEIPQGKLSDYLIASSSCFPAFKVKQIDKETYIDGGYHDSVPINLAVRMGASKIIAIDIKSIGIKKRTKEKNIDVITIAPTKNLGMPLTFEKEVSIKNFLYGYNDALKTFDKAFGKYYSFESQTYDQLLEDRFYQIYDQIFSNKKINSIFLSSKLFYYKKLKLKNKKELFILFIEKTGKLYSLIDTQLYDLKKYNEMICNNFIVDTNHQQKQFVVLNKNEKIMFFYEKLTNIFLHNQKVDILIPYINLTPENLLVAIYLFTITTKDLI